MTVSLPLSFGGPAYADPARVVSGQRRLESQLAGIPGAASVALSYDHPLEANWTDSFTMSGSAAARDDVQGSAELRIVSPGYFDALGVALIEGQVHEGILDPSCHGLPFEVFGCALGGVREVELEV